LGGVEADGVGEVWGEGACDEAGAAAYVEECVELAAVGIVLVEDCLV